MINTFFLVAFALLVTTVAKADPGLVAVYSDGKTTVHRVVPTPNFTLAANESVHSQIAAKFDAVYSGVLQISRGGEYTISGGARIEVDGKDVADKTAKLTSGDHALKIAYRREAGPARLQLRWKSDFFVEEPVPPAAFGHAKTDDPQFKRWTEIERGRVLYENLSCGACHGNSGWNLSARKGPILSDIGSRATADWLYRWLQQPRHYRKTAAMPVLVSDDGELRDVTAFLLKLIESPAGGADSARNPQRIEAGKEIFERVGCNKCHGEKPNSLAGVGSKFSSSGALAKYLADPLHVDPSGRMPQMFDPKTQSADAELVAEYLFHMKKANAALPTFPGGGDAKRGRELVQSRGCVSCHSIKDSGEALASKAKSPQLAAPGARFDPSNDCLAARPGKGIPNYQLTETDRMNLQAFLSSIAEHPVIAKAPVETFYRRVNQFNCTACHSLNDQNAGPARVVTNEGKIVNLERPPSLTGAGAKLQVNWIREVLLNKKRTRPWMRMRMPHFGGELEPLPALFPAASGSPPADESPPPSFELAKAGLETIGVQRGKTACINCHNFRGIDQQQEGVVPAPDLAEVGQTLRRDWFRRWLHNPPRMQPGTSMPQFFLELKGDQREQKIGELWAALVHQARLPLPNGLLQQRTEGTRIVVGDHPVVFRVATKLMPKLQIDRAINVGLPGRKNFLFDAATARLRGVWKGEFIDAAPAWNGRGGNPVTVVPESLYVAPDYFPLRIGSRESQPKTRFLGYDLVEQHPVFRYLVDGVEVHERIDVTDTELVRRFTLADTKKPVFFVDDKERGYTSSSGKFHDGVLKIPAGENLQFVVRRSLPRDNASGKGDWFRGEHALESLETVASRCLSPCSRTITNSVGPPGK